MARTIVVTDVTAANGAAVAPVQNHGRWPYSHLAGHVKGTGPYARPMTDNSSVSPSKILPALPNL